MRVLINILLVIISFSCINSQDFSGNRLNISDEKYLKGKLQFPDSIVSFLPQSIKELQLPDTFIINSSYRNNPKDILYLCFYAYNSDKFDHLMSTMNYSSSLFDSCNVFIGNNVKRYGFDRLREDRIDCREFIPLPEPELFSLPDYPRDIRFNILSFSKGVFFNYNPINNRRYLPEEYKNGISKGFATSETTGLIYFWVIIW